jgi:cyclopropane fatty-acyl-phospholipid synthase-like methyltransferase
MDYNRLAAEYARNRQINPEVLQALIEGGPVKSSSTVLEVGCGTGNYIITLAASTGCQGWGIEPSIEMLSRARARVSSVRFEQASAENIALAANVFDLVFSVDVIHHVTDCRAYFQGDYRVLKPGGRLCTVTDSAAIIQRRQPLSVYFPETITPELKRYPRTADLTGWMQRAGFIDVQEREVEFPYEITDLQPYREKAFSALHLISEAAFLTGIERMEADLRDAGKIRGASRYVLLWGMKPY